MLDFAKPRKPSKLVPLDDSLRPKNPEQESVDDLNKNQSISIPITFWSTLRDILADSTVHGVANIFRTRNRIVRFVWIGLALGGLGCAVYFTYLSTMGFFNYQTTVSVQAIDESPAVFP
jgi:hypothetical protein